MSQPLIYLTLIALGWALCAWVRRGEPMEPGICECSHERCAHVKGRYRCHVTPSPGVLCACQHFILDVSDEAVKDPEVAELRRMVKL